MSLSRTFGRRELPNQRKFLPRAPPQVPHATLKARSRLPLPSHYYRRKYFQGRAIEEKGIIRGQPIRETKVCWEGTMWPSAFLSLWNFWKRRKAKKKGSWALGSLVTTRLREDEAWRTRLYQSRNVLYKPVKIIAQMVPWSWCHGL